MFSVELGAKVMAAHNAGHPAPAATTVSPLPTVRPLRIEMSPEVGRARTTWGLAKEAIIADERRATKVALGATPRIHTQQRKGLMVAEYTRFRSLPGAFLRNGSRSICIPADMLVDVVIPALNEAAAIPAVLAAIPRPPVRRIVVADNGSIDGTGAVAKAGGAEVVVEHERGYGAACLRALAHLRADPPEVVVFLDGDHSDHPEELPLLLDPIERGVADFVVGSRTLGRAEQGSLTPQQRVGNRIACVVLDRVYGARYTDLGPFRAIRWSSLAQLDMGDRNYGWTAEMQIRAARAGLRHTEVPVRYRRRIGQSKVSGTVRGTALASAKILWTLARHARS